jgi:hypothetical protein
MWYFDEFAYIVGVAWAEQRAVPASVRVASEAERREVRMRWFINLKVSGKMEQVVADIQIGVAILFTGIRSYWIRDVSLDVADWFVACPVLDMPKLFLWTQGSSVRLYLGVISLGSRQCAVATCCNG